MPGNFSIGVERRRTVEAAAGSTIAGFGGRLSTAATALKQSFTDGTIFLPLIALALWALTHPYQGILGDATVYIGRALADLDPAGIGRDMMFVNDGQSRFSVFPLVLDRLVAVFGTGPTALALALLATAAWLFALAGFARQFVATRWIAVVVIFVAVLPVSYGAPWRFSYSEVLAVPRPFAEALVLAALPALVAGRTWLAIFVLVAASLIHPLMSLAGWAVFAIVLCGEDRRWALAAALAAALVLAGALLGVPILDGLVTLMNPDLKAFAESRSPLLFPTAWPIDFLGPVAVEATTIAIAASFFDGRRRMVLLAAIFAGIGGIAVQALFGDRLSLLLVIQAQPWRMAWLLAATGAIALAIATLKLWQQGPRGQVVLATLAMAWLSSEESVYGALMCVPALALHFGARWITVPIASTIARTVWGTAFALALFWNIHYFMSYGRFLAVIPAEGPHYVSYFWNRRYVAFPILALVLAFVFARPSRLIWGAQCAAVVLLILCVVRFWDQRATFQKMADADIHPPALMNLIAGSSGEVLWIDGSAEAWFLTGRPQWASPQQGVSTIFSPTLANTWRARMQFLISQGLAEKNALSALHVPPAADLPRLTHDGIIHLCARPDAPAFVIAPVEEGIAIPPEFKPQYWHLAQPNFRMTEEPDFYGWQRISAYAVLPCAQSWRR
jgi:hypothetical protein